MSNYTYRLNEGQLSSLTRDLGDIIWSGRPRDVNVVSFEQIPETDDCLVLLDPIQAGSLLIKNVLRITPFGVIVWEVRLPEKFNNVPGIGRENDVYVRIYTISNTFASINSYSGFLEDIDFESGEVINSVFVK